MKGGAFESIVSCDTGVSHHAILAPVFHMGTWADGRIGEGGEEIGVIEAEIVAPFVEINPCVGAFDHRAFGSDKSDAAIASPAGAEDHGIEVEVCGVVRVVARAIGVSGGEGASDAEETHAEGGVGGFGAWEIKSGSEGEASLRFSVRPSGQNIYDFLEFGLDGGIWGGLEADGLIGEADADGEELFISLSPSGGNDWADSTGVA